MGYVLYLIASRLYFIGIRLAAWFNPKARAWVAGQRQVWAQLSAVRQAAGEEPLMWFHCASVGEYEQGRPVMEALKERLPGCRILVTFFSPSGYEAMNTDRVVDFKAWLPADSPARARRFVEAIRPRAAFFIKYEFWYFYLHTLRKRNIPVFSVSAVFRPGQLFFKPYGRFYRQLLQAFTHFFVQDERSRQLLDRYGLPVSVAGDTRIDRVLAISETPAELPRIAAFVSGRPVFVVGSLRPEDRPVVTAFVGHHPELVFIIAPHEVDEDSLRALEKLLPSSVRYSVFKAGDNSQVLIIDNVGMLSRLYRYGRAAYVGGGFSDGLHNILEAAAYRIPVFFGSRAWHKFREAHDLLELGAAFAVSDSADLVRQYETVTADPARLAEIRNKLDIYLEANRGAAGRIVKKVLPHLS